jgi:hypothetical protein
VGVGVGWGRGWGWGYPVYYPVAYPMAVGTTTVVYRDSLRPGYDYSPYTHYPPREQVALQVQPTPPPQPSATEQEVLQPAKLQELEEGVYLTDDGFIVTIGPDGKITITNQYEDGCDLFDEDAFNAELNYIVDETIANDFNQRIGWCSVKKSAR